jgi:hypothetical protein
LGNAGIGIVIREEMGECGKKGICVRVKEWREICRALGWGFNGIVRTPIRIVGIKSLHGQELEHVMKRNDGGI